MEKVGGMEIFRRLRHNLGREERYPYGGIMPTHSVNLRLVPSLSVECKFWRKDDGWSGHAEPFAITVHASSFQEAKTELEAALGKYIESVLRESKASAA